MGRYTLPDLPYDYGALEPRINGQIDAWEHAYYLPHKNVWPDFVKAIREDVNWP